MSSWRRVGSMRSVLFPVLAVISIYGYATDQVEETMGDGCCGEGRADHGQLNRCGGAAAAGFGWSSAFLRAVETIATELIGVNVAYDEVERASYCGDGTSGLTRARAVGILALCWSDPAAIIDFLRFRELARHNGLVRWRSRVSYDGSPAIACAC